MAFSACVLTVSTRGARGERQDESGEKVSEMLARLPAEIVARAVVGDDVAEIREQLKTWIRAAAPDLIVLTGGTGLSPQDVTPQALLPMLDYLIPGMGEAMRAAGLRKTPHAMLSRSLAGVTGKPSSWRCQVARGASRTASRRSSKPCPMDCARSAERSGTHPRRTVPADRL